MFLTHPIELLGDMGHVESCFGLFGVCVSVDARYMHGFCQMYHQLRNHFRRTRWYSLVTRLKWKLVLVHLEVVRIWMQDRCMVCAKHTKGSENIFDAPD